MVGHRYQIFQGGQEDQRGRRGSYFGGRESGTCSRAGETFSYQLAKIRSSQATVTPSTMALNPPGMAVLENPPTLAYSRLCLEADFGWTGKSRLLAAGSQMAR